MHCLNFGRLRILILIPYLNACGFASKLTVCCVFWLCRFYYQPFGSYQSGIPGNIDFRTSGLPRSVVFTFCRRSKTYLIGLSRSWERKKSFSFGFFDCHSRRWLIDMGFYRPLWLTSKSTPISMLGYPPPSATASTAGLEDSFGCCTTQTSTTGWDFLFRILHSVGKSPKMSHLNFHA